MYNNLSTKWKNWIAQIDVTTCKKCRDNHGKIYPIDETVIPPPPLHINCRCRIELMKVIYAGLATDMGIDGADWYLKYLGKLPEYYISKKDAKDLGWDSKLGNLNTVLPNKMIFGGIYKNKNGKLPEAAGRIWYECDINYNLGRRNTERVLFSNDGLIFVTYDHYKTFIEIE